MRLPLLLKVPALLGSLVSSLVVSSFAYSADPAPSSSATPPPAASASAATAESVAAQVQAFYDKVTTFEADFDQNYDMKAFGTKKNSKGHVVFQKAGGKMRWDYTEPAGNLVVSDGVTLWSYTPKEKQARKMLVKDSQMPTALSFLTGKGNLATDFNLKLLSGSALKFDGGYVLEARPKVVTNLYNYVLFYVDSKTSHVRRVLIVDAQDNRNRFDFDKPKVNEKVDPDKFKWSPPAGVTIISN
jgi:outer membrane lipoprotein carrier protein